MDGVENQAVIDYRGRLEDKMKSRYPDRYGDGTNGTNSPISLEQSLLEAYEADETRISDLTKLEEKTSALTDLLNKYSRSAVFLNALAENGDPAAAIYKAYGKDAYDAFVSGNASDLIANIEAEDEKRRAENEAFEAAKAENLKTSFETLDRYAQAKGLSEDEAVEYFTLAHGFACDAVEGNYSEEFFDMIYKAKRYEEDVENARKEGEVAGRNAKFDELKRKRQVASAMPPQMSGQGVRAEESRPVNKKDDDPWMLG